MSQDTIVAKERNTSLCVFFTSITGALQEHELSYASLKNSLCQHYSYYEPQKVFNPDCFIILETEFKTSLEYQRTDSQLKHHLITPTLTT